VVVVTVAGADEVSQRNRGADVGLETALLERTRHTTRSAYSCAPGPPGPGLEVVRGGRRLGRPGFLRSLCGASQPC
jgi:hypothetical protein